MMKAWESLQSNYRPLRLGLAAGMAILLLVTLITLLGASASSAFTAISVLANQETGGVSHSSAITIGATAPLSPPGSANAGAAMKVAFEIARDEINAAGGVLGTPIQLVINDTAGTPQLGEEAMDNFANQAGVASVVGEYHSVTKICPQLLSKVLDDYQQRDEELRPDPQFCYRTLFEKPGFFTGASASNGLNRLENQRFVSRGWSKTWFLSPVVESVR